MIGKDNNRTSNKVYSPHDRFFKSMMVRPEINKDFLTANLPSYIKDIVDLNTIKFHKESFIDQQLQLKMVDMLIEAKFLDEIGYICISRTSK